MIYVFDIDGTICNNTNGNYESSFPIKERIDHINELYDKGNKIIFFTARGMKRFSGNCEEVNNKFYNFTYEQLKKWGLKFHELKMCKPEADIFVDDKGVSDEHYFSANIRP